MTLASRVFLFGSCCSSCSVDVLVTVKQNDGTLVVGLCSLAELQVSFSCSSRTRLASFACSSALSSGSGRFFRSPACLWSTPHAPHRALTAFWLPCCSVLAAEKIFLAAKALQRCNRKELRALCIAWDINRRHAGGQGERPVHVCKAELHAKLAKRVRELQEKNICDSASEQRPHTSAPS